jgi:hypothetical protein
LLLFLKVFDAQPVLMPWVRASVDLNLLCGPSVLPAVGFTALMRASDKGHAAAAEVLIELGADVNLRDSFRSTALLWACANGHLDVVDVLLVCARVFLACVVLVLGVGVGVRVHSLFLLFRWLEGAVLRVFLCLPRAAAFVQVNGARFDFKVRRFSFPGACK